MELDVADDASVQRGVAQVLDTAGHIDVLVNNAAVAHYGTVELMPWDWLRETFDTNFYGPVRMIRAVLPSMRERESGTIVNVSSANGRMRGLGFAGMYGASKHALGTMSEALATEVEPFNIQVVVIEPGAFGPTSSTTAPCNSIRARRTPSSKPPSTPRARPAIRSPKIRAWLPTRSLRPPTRADRCTCSSATTPSCGWPPRNHRRSSSGAPKSAHPALHLRIVQLGARGVLR